MFVTVTAPPTALPVGLQSIREQCRVDTADEAGLLQDYVASATEHAEQMLGMSLMPRTLTAKFEEGEPLHLPRGPVSQVQAVTDASGTPVSYRHVRVGNSDRIATSHTGPMTVVYNAGYATVPADIVAAIRVHAATLYGWREDKSAAAANAVYKLDDFYRARSFHPQVA